MLKLNKQQLDKLTTLLGFIGGLSGVLATNEVPPIKFWSLVAALAIFLLGFLTQRPAAARPTTEQAEEQKLDGH